MSKKKFILIIVMGEKLLRKFMNLKQKKISSKKQFIDNIHIFRNKNTITLYYYKLIYNIIKIKQYIKNIQLYLVKY